MQGAKCAISKLMYGSSVCRDDNHSLKLVAYRLVHTDEPYINLHLWYEKALILYFVYYLKDLGCLFVIPHFINLTFIQCGNIF